MKASMANSVDTSKRILTSEDGWIEMKRGQRYIARSVKYITNEAICAHAWLHDIQLMTMAILMGMPMVQFFFRRFPHTKNFYIKI